MTIILLVITFPCTAGQFNVEPLSPQQFDYVTETLEGAIGSQVVMSAAIHTQLHGMEAYYIGASFTLSGMREPIHGVWLITGKKEAPEKIYSVNSFAFLFSGVKMARKMNIPASEEDEESRVLYDLLVANE